MFKDKVKAIGKVAASKLGRAGLKLKKYSPEILLVVGVAAGAAAIYYTIKATATYKDEIEPRYMDDMDDADYARAQGDSETADQMVKEAKIERLKLTAKAYSFAFIFYMISLTAYLSAHGILKGRETTALAACKVLGDRVKALENGEKDIPEETEKDEKAEEEPDEEKKSYSPCLSPFERIFEEGSSVKWDRNKLYTENFLKTQQNYLNDILEIQGHVFVNDIWDALGFPRTSEGCIYGYLKEDGKHIDLGLNDKTNPRLHAFLDPNDPEDAVLIHLNDPVLIWDRI